MYTVIYKEEATGRVHEQWGAAQAIDITELQVLLNTLAKDGYTIFQVLYRGN